MRILRVVLIIFVAGFFADTVSAANHGAPFWWENAVKEARENGYTLLTPEEMTARLHSDPNCLLVDVRPDYEFETGHIPGAVNLMFSPGDRMAISPEKEQQFKALLGPDKNRCIIIHCRDFR